MRSRHEVVAELVIGVLICGDHRSDDGPRKVVQEGVDGDFEGRDQRRVTTLLDDVNGDKGVGEEGRGPVVEHPDLKMVVGDHLVVVFVGGCSQGPVLDQVWSLTQFYSVDFSRSRISVKSAFSTKAQSRFASVVVDGVLGPPCLARHT